MAADLDLYPQGSIVEEVVTNPGTGIPETVFVCGICTDRQTFGRLADLRRHLRTIHHPDPFKMFVFLFVRPALFETDLCVSYVYCPEKGCGYRSWNRTNVDSHIRHTQ